MGKAKVQGFNEHHVLCPKRIWRALLGKTPEFRGVFIVTMPIDEHNQLHSMMFKEFGELTELDFPKPGTIRSIVKSYNMQRKRISGMDIDQKIDWLIGKLNPRKQRNQTLIAILKMQKACFSEPQRR